MKKLGKKIVKWTLIPLGVLFLLILLLVFYYSLPLFGEIPEEVKAKTIEISGKNQDDIEFAKETTQFIVDKWESPFGEYRRKILRPFIKTYKTAWEIPDGEYQASNVEARLVEKMLLESGRFTKDEIKYTHGFCVRSPHGYLEINKITRGKQMSFYLDTWSTEYGACLGQFASVGCEIPDSFMGECV